MPLPPQTAFGHQPPIPFKAFVASPARPEIGGFLRFLVVTQKFVAIVAIAVILHLQTLLFRERRQQQRKLILKLV